MGKKRNLNTTVDLTHVKIEIKDEIPDNEVYAARGRLKSALKDLSRNSDDPSSADSSEESPQELKHSPKKIQKPTPVPAKKIRRRRTAPVDQLFHHTYVMKLFDRSVDLAQFREETPLYPICRAWIANQPRNPHLVPKLRSPSPEIINEIHPDNLIQDGTGELRDVYNLPLPLEREEVFPNNRIPSPILGAKEELNLDYDEETLKPRETLMKEHRAHWNAVRKKWHQRAHKNEQRFADSASILSTIFKRAVSEFEQ